jgi:plastocyanin
VIAIVVIGGGYWVLQGSTAPATVSDGAASQTQLEGTPAPADNGTTVGVDATVDVNAAPMSATVTYDGSSYSPASVTIKQGGSVTFTSTAGNMWVASGPHPAHTGYDSTSRSQHCAAGYTGAASFDQCVAGTTYTFTFNKAGTWPYHNHIQDGAYGSVTVVQ